MPANAVNYFYVAARLVGVNRTLRWRQLNLTAQFDEFAQIPTRDLNRKKVLFNLEMTAKSVKINFLC